jgi:hypothetical protein
VATTLLRVVCRCGYEAYANDPPKDCPACSAQLLVEPYVSERRMPDVRGRRRDGSPELVWTECWSCHRTMISDESDVRKLCPRCRSEQPKMDSLKGLDPWAKHPGGSDPDGA